ncbi:MAG: hypothetical protein JWN66_4245 [Sphingomonas bacterium]|uniref:hypothetical protein n=1 Tax=Sphingomonas bacterium TaxID=1895847 RepID=UPI00260C34D3|nr:hypothetical protein [Sphingomonas bacterium]MDB5707129.1 hypothetical protein [Sphingomonas bacterium]
MRIILGLAVTAMGAATQPCWAQQRPDVPFGAAAMISIVPEQTIKIAPGIGLRVALVPAMSRDPFAYTEGRLQQRVDSSMIDFFPTGGDGFHLSAGMRLFARRNVDRTFRGLVTMPKGRGVGGFGGRRFTPAATFGYSHALGEDAEFGFEAGAVMGRLNSGMSGQLRQSSSDGHGLNGLRPITGINSIAHFTFGYKF